DQQQSDNLKEEETSSGPRSSKPEKEMEIEEFQQFKDQGRSASLNILKSSDNKQKGSSVLRNSSSSIPRTSVTKTASLSSVDNKAVTFNSNSGISRIDSSASRNSTAPRRFQSTTLKDLEEEQGQTSPSEASSSDSETTPISSRKNSIQQSSAGRSDHPPRTIGSPREGQPRHDQQQSDNLKEEETSSGPRSSKPEKEMEIEEFQVEDWDERSCALYLLYAVWVEIYALKSYKRHKEAKGRCTWINLFEAHKAVQLFLTMSFAAFLTSTASLCDVRQLSSLGLSAIVLGRLCKICRSLYRCIVCLHFLTVVSDLIPIPVATSNILKKMTDPNLPTMQTRINGLALLLTEKTWAQKELDAHPDLATTWTPETDDNLTAFIKQSATQSAPPARIYTAERGRFGCSHATRKGYLKCQMTGEEHYKGDVNAAHILPQRAVAFLPVFGLKTDDINSVRNGLLLCRGIERAFDKQQ
ncbi:hypothetical protein PROFUN_16992, partial [Planoprotostelium fungivorum]